MGTKSHLTLFLAFIMGGATFAHAHTIPGPGPSDPAAPSPTYDLPPEPQERILREGLMLGFAVGGGWVRSGQGSQGGYAFSVDAGGTVTPHLAVMFEYQSISKNLDNFSSINHSVVGGAVQLFFQDFFWARAGMGIGFMRDDRRAIIGTDRARAPAITLGIGAEPLQTTGGFALDMQLRFSAARYPGGIKPTIASHLAFLLGMNWY